MHVLDVDHHAHGADADHGQEAVTEHRRDAVCVDPALGHEVEEGVYRERAEQREAVNVPELRLAGLRATSARHIAVAGGRTKRRKVPKQK